MVQSLVSGALLAVVGGAMTGSFSVPMKLQTNWPWANSWLVYSVVGLLLIPIGLAVHSVPHLLAAYLAASPGAVARTTLFGLGWGIG